MKTRSVLKELQQSAANKTVLVGSPVSKLTPSTKLAPISEKCFESIKKKTKVPKRTLEKENGKTNQLTKGKYAKTEKVSKISKSEIKKPLKVKQDFKCPLPKENEASTSNHSKVTSFLPASPSLCDIQASSKFDIGNVTVDQNVSDIIPLVTSNSYSHSYWHDLAEQRRLALEKTLLENEQLTDQVTVLQAENTLLKDALDSAEKLLKIEGLLD